jgi:hypothetical protein
MIKSAMDRRTMLKLLMAAGMGGVGTVLGVAIDGAQCLSEGMAVAGLLLWRISSSGRYESARGVAEIAPEQVRSALIRWSLGAEGTFDGKGWLTIGFCEH